MPVFRTQLYPAAVDLGGEWGMVKQGSSSSASKPFSMNSAMVSLNRFWMSSMLPMFAICSSSRIFSRRAFSSGGTVLSGHVFYLLCDASILHLMGGLHKVWDGLWRRGHFHRLHGQLDGI